MLHCVIISLTKTKPKCKHCVKKKKKKSTLYDAVGFKTTFNRNSSSSKNNN